MKNVSRQACLVGISVIAAVLILGPSLVEAQMREFSGQIKRINDKKMIVDNRMGDNVSFIRVDSTEVTGEDKTKWDELKQKDWVTVSWKFIDKPRKAYKVLVLPPKEEDEDD